MLFSLCCVSLQITRLVWMDATLGTILYTGQVPFIPLHLLPLQSVNPYHHHSAAPPAEEKPQRIFEESNAVFLVAAQGGGRAFLMVPEKTGKTVEITSKVRRKGPIVCTNFVQCNN